MNANVHIETKGNICNATYELAKRKWPESFPEGGKPIVPAGLGGRLSTVTHCEELALYTAAAAIHANLI